MQRRNQKLLLPYAVTINVNHPTSTVHPVAATMHVNQPTATLPPQAIEITDRIHLQDR